MTEEEIKIQLDKLAEYRAQRDLINMDKQALIDMILTNEIKEKIAEIEAEFSGRMNAVSDNISSLESDIKTAVVTLGNSVKGNDIQAVYVKGRISWDPKSLDGYAVGHPEILHFRKEGDPSVSLRITK